MDINFKGKKKNYNLSSDDKQFTLSEVVKAKTGKNKGEFQYRPIAHYGTLEQVFKRLLQLEINEKDIKTFEGLFQAIIDTKQWISTLVSEKSESPDLVA